MFVAVQVEQQTQTSVGGNFCKVEHSANVRGDISFIIVSKLLYLYIFIVFLSVS